VAEAVVTASVVVAPSDRVMGSVLAVSLSNSLSKVVADAEVAIISVVVVAVSSSVSVQVSEEGNKEVSEIVTDSLAVESLVVISAVVKPVVTRDREGLHGDEAAN